MPRLDAATDGEPADAEQLREWIVTNGLGGYASGTVCGVPTRRYHGLLIAALPAPLGRTMMLNQLDERLGLPDGRSPRSASRRSPAGRPHDGRPAGSPSSASRPGCRSGGSRSAGSSWRSGSLLPHLQNTVYVTYRLVGDGERRPERPAPAPAAAGPLPLARRAGRTRPIPALIGSPPGATATRSRPAGRSRRCG